MFESGSARARVRDLSDRVAEDHTDDIGDFPWPPARISDDDAFGGDYFDNADAEDGASSIGNPEIGGRYDHGNNDPYERDSDVVLADELDTALSGGSWTGF